MWITLSGNRNYKTSDLKFVDENTIQFTDIKKNLITVKAHHVEGVQLEYKENII